MFLIGPVMYNFALSDLVFGPSAFVLLMGFIECARVAQHTKIISLLLAVESSHRVSLIFPTCNQEEVLDCSNLWSRK